MTWRASPSMPFMQLRQTEYGSRWGIMLHQWRNKTCCDWSQVFICGPCHSRRKHFCRDWQFLHKKSTSWKQARLLDHHLIGWRLLEHARRTWSHGRFIIDNSCLFIYFTKWVVRESELYRGYESQDESCRRQCICFRWGSVESNMCRGRQKNRHRRGKEERQSASSSSNVHPVHRIHITKEVMQQSAEKMKYKSLSTHMGSP